MQATRSVEYLNPFVTGTSPSLKIAYFSTG